MQYSSLQLGIAVDFNIFFYCASRKFSFILFLADLEARGRDREAQHETRLEAIRHDLAEARDQLAAEVEARRSLRKEAEGAQRRIRDVESEAVKQADSFRKETEGALRRIRDLESEAVKQAEVLSSLEKEWKERQLKTASDLDLVIKDREVLSGDKKRLEDTVHKLEVNVVDLEMVKNSEMEARSELSEKVAVLTEKNTALEAVSKSLAEEKSRLEADLEAGERQRERLAEQMAELAEVRKQDEENIRLLKEAKSYLESEKMRLEAGILEGEARAKEMEKTVVEGANRIAELGETKKTNILKYRIRILIIFERVFLLYPDPP
jgi:chromosome segregation ATPase